MKTGCFISIVLLWTSCFSSPAPDQAHTGIPEIDSLPVDDWYVKTNTLSYGKAVLYSLFFPGGGQLYSKHFVKAGFLIGMEGLLLYDALPAKRQVFRMKNNIVNQYMDSSFIVLQSAAIYPDSGTFRSEHENFIQKARRSLDVKMKILDLKKSEIAWALGLHFYGMMDALEIVYKSRRGSVQAVSGSSALWRAICFPGGGQLYNRKFGKFGMLWMAIGAGALSAHYRQQMVNHFQNRIDILKEENLYNQTPKTMETLREEATLYRKRRNQYYWGIGLLYIYSIGDAIVDAILHDFDSQKNFAMTPGKSPFSVQLMYWF